MTTGDEIQRLERVVLATWPALETEERDGWVSRASAGVTGRANSLAVIAPGEPDPERLDAVERWYQDRGLPPLVRTTPLTSTWLRRELSARGYSPWPSPSEVMTRGLGEVEAPVDAAEPVRLSEAGDDAWWALTGRSDADRAVLEQAFERSAAPAIHASLRIDDEIVAIGQAAVALGHVAIFSMNTVERHRGRGLAGLVLDALESWGCARGARTACLQVVTANTPAKRLYRARGYVSKYSYEYLRATG